MYCTSRGKGEAVLFIHGMPTNRMLWNGIIQQLSRSYRCFAIDLPGMGESAPVRYSPNYLNELAEQIETLRMQYGVTRWHVVGHDAGAAVAVNYAGHFSQYVSSLALLSPAIFPELEPFYLLNALRKPVLGEVLAPLVHLLFWHVAMRRAVADDAKHSLLRAFRKPFTGRAGAWQLMRLVRWGKPEELLGAIPDMLPGLPMPVLVFHGSRDVLPPTFAERAVSLIPRCSLVTVESGHFIPLERSDEVASRLRGFFKANGAEERLRSPMGQRVKRNGSVPVWSLDPKAANATLPAGVSS